MPNQVRNRFETTPDTSEIERGPVADNQQEEGFGALVEFIKKHIMVLGAVLLLGLAVAQAVNVLRPKLYTAFAQIEIAGDQSSQFRLGDTQGLAGLGGGDAEKIDTEIQVLKSRTLALETIRTLHLENNPDFLPFKGVHGWDLSNPAMRDALVATFEGDVDVSRVKTTSLIGIRTTTLQPALSSLITNTLIDNYIEHSFQENYSSTVKVSNWLSTQLNGLKRNLEKSQTEMLAYQKRLGVVGLSSSPSGLGPSLGLGSSSKIDSSPGLGPASEGGSSNVVLDKLDLMNQNLARAEVDRMVAEARLQALRNSSAGAVDAMGEVADPTLASNKQILAQAISRYTTMSQTYGSAYPPLRTLKAQIQQLKGSVASEEANVIAAAESNYNAALKNETMLRNAVNSAERDAFNQEEKGAQFGFIREDYETNRLLYDGLQERLLEAQVLAGLHSSAIQIVDNAEMPAAPSFPRKRINLAIGAGAGLLMGFLVSLVLDGLDSNLKGIADIEHNLHLPLLAAIPQVGTEELVPAKYREVAFSSGSTSWSKILEALRGVRTSILLSSPGSAPKVVMVTSSRPAEGKSSLATLLAITFALSGSRVLLIDADLRRPSVHVRIGLPKGKGLSSILSGEADVKEAIESWVHLPNLHILTAGPAPPLPSELLGSAQMERMLQGLRKDYDFILIDTPPVLVVTDAAVMARNTDATLLVIRYDSIKRHVVERSLDVLDRSGAHLLGAVLNAVDLKAPEYSEYYGKKYYEYYGDRSE